MQTDEKLYKDYLQGDTGALRVLLERYNESLTWFLYEIVGNFEDAEEIEMDTFAVLFEAGKHFQGNCSFKTWLFAIGRKLASKHLRRNRIKTVHFQSVEDLPHYIAENIPDQAIMQEERRGELLRIIEGMKAEYREVLFLTFFEDMTRSEIGKIMKKSEKQVSDLLYNSKKALKMLLEREGFEYEDYR